jgi:hypothetical protein
VTFFLFPSFFSYSLWNHPLWCRVDWKIDQCDKKSHGERENIYVCV